jgi:hypothetical protein
MCGPLAANVLTTGLAWMRVGVTHELVHGVEVKDRPCNIAFRKRSSARPAALRRQSGSPKESLRSCRANAAGSHRQFPNVAG